LFNYEDKNEETTYSLKKARRRPHPDLEGQEERVISRPKETKS